MKQMLVFILKSHYLREKNKPQFTMPYSPSTVANYFVKQYSKLGALTPMKLIKLTYVSYGWYLALSDGKRLINEEPEAWDYGPVFPTLYESLKKYGKLEVNEPIPYTSTEVISSEDAAFLDIIWEMYGEFDGVYLSALTHKEGTPWSETFVSKANRKIPDALIRAHYEPMLKPAV